MYFHRDFGLDMGSGEGYIGPEQEPRFRRKILIRLQGPFQVVDYSSSGMISFIVFICSLYLVFSGIIQE